MICSTRELLCGLRDISCRALVLATKISHPGISISSQETLINPPPRKLSETIFVHDHVTNHFLPPIFFRRPDLFCWGGLKILWPIRNLVGMFLLFCYGKRHVNRLTCWIFTIFRFFSGCFLCHILTTLVDKKSLVKILKVCLFESFESLQKERKNVEK